MARRRALGDSRTGEAWISQALALGISVMLFLGLAFAAFDYVVPKAPTAVHCSQRRVGWYLSSGQWRADMRTLASAVRFIVNSDAGSQSSATGPRPN